MKLLYKKILFTVINLLLLINIISSSLSLSPVSPFSTTASSQRTIPFDNLYLKYNLKAKRDNSAIYSVDLYVNYTKILDNSSSGFDYQQKLVFKSILLAFLGETQENATFFENSSTRLIYLNSTEGSYVNWLIYYVFAYNSTEGALNWEPFWIVPSQVNNSYPIYSFNFNLTKTETISHDDLNVFQSTRIVLVFNGQQVVISGNDTFLNTFGLIYDNNTGILVKGVLDSTVVGLNTTKNYYANFELAETNAFQVTEINSTTTTNNKLPIVIPAQLNKPNYLFLLIIMVFPIIITCTRLMRLKEIKGGSE